MLNRGDSVIKFYTFQRYKKRGVLAPLSLFLTLLLLLNQAFTTNLIRLLNFNDICTRIKLF